MDEKKKQPSRMNPSRAMLFGNEKKKKGISERKSNWRAYVYSLVFLRYNCYIRLWEASYAHPSERRKTL